MVTEGVFTPQGEFLPLPKPANSILKVIEERFRRLLLKRLHRAERLSEEFMNRLLQWNPSGFSVYAEQLVWDDEPQPAFAKASARQAGWKNSPATSPALPFELTG